MSFASGSWLVDVSILLLTLVAGLFLWTQWRFNYFRRRGLLTPPTTFFLGNGKGFLTQSDTFGDIMLNAYNYLKERNQKHGGLYLLHQPMYLPVDPDIVKRIILTDFNYFIDRGLYFNEESDPLSAHLFNIEGAKWKSLRVKLTPTFTSGKMKGMFETLTKCGDQLAVEMDKTIGQSINIKDILIRFTTDIIGNCAFGIECNSLKYHDNELVKQLSSFFSEGFWENIITVVTFLAPEFSRMLRLKITKPTLNEFFMKMITDTVNYREQNNVHRKDFMHLLLQLKNKGKLTDDESVVKEKIDGGDNLTLNELAAQAFVFFLAGFETSSTTMTFCLFELASNPDVQEKLREEVTRVLEKHDDKLTYDAIMEMTYMDKVVNETLRKYPPLPALNRVCTKDYKIPGTDIVLEKGTKVSIPVLGLHRDPEYYPDPEKFDPDRFSEENKKTRPPYTFIPFGEGPRICIGMRFGLMQTKVGLSVLLKNYRFSLSSKTVVPFTFDPRSFVMVTEGGIWLDYDKV